MNLTSAYVPPTFLKPCLVIELYTKHCPQDFKWDISITEGRTRA